MDLKLIRTLTLLMETQGADKMASDLHKVQSAHEGVSKAASTTASTTERAAKSGESLSAALSKYQRQFDPVLRNQIAYEKVHREMQALVRQTPEHFAEANAVLLKAERHYEALSQAAVLSGRAVVDSGKAVDGASNAFTSHAAGARLARHELINLSRQAQDVGVSLFSGQSPLTVLVQQGSQIADVFANSTGTMRGFFGQIGSGIARIFTPMRLMVGGVAGIGVAALSAASSWGSAQLEVTRSLQGIGRASGATVNDITKIGVAASSTFGLSISEATEAASAYAATGKIATHEIETLTKITKDFAATLNMDVGEAVKVMASAFSDPVKGADELGKRLGGMSPIIREQIELFSQLNKRADAQRVLVQAITPQLTEANKVTGFWGASWAGISNVASNVWTGFGKAMSDITGIGEADADKLKNLRREYDLLLGAINNPIKKQAFFTGDSDSLLARARTTAAEMAKVQASIDKNTLEAAAQAFRDLANKGQEFADKLDPATARMRELNAQLNIFNTVLASDNRNLVLSPEQVAQWERGRDILNNYVQTINELRAAYGGVSAETATRLQQMQTEAALAMQLSDAGRQAVQVQQFANAVRQQLIPIAEQERLITQQIITQQAQLTGAYANAAQQRQFASAQSLQAAQVESQIIGMSVEQQARIRGELQATQQIQAQLFQQYGSIGLQAIQTQNRQALAVELTKSAYQQLLAQVGPVAAAEIKAGNDVVGVQYEIIEAYDKRVRAAQAAAGEIIKGAKSEIDAAKETAAAIARVSGPSANQQASESAARDLQLSDGMRQNSESMSRNAAAISDTWSRGANQWKQMEQSSGNMLMDSFEIETNRRATLTMQQQLDESFAVGGKSQFGSNMGGSTPGTQFITSSMKAMFERFGGQGNVGAIAGGLGPNLYAPTQAGISAARSYDIGRLEQAPLGSMVDRTGSWGTTFNNNPSSGGLANDTMLMFNNAIKIAGGVNDKNMSLLQRLVAVTSDEQKPTMLNQMIAAVSREPATLARAELLKSLNDQLKSLTDATGSLEDTMKLQLDPLFSQGHDYINALKIGYYKAATGLTGIVGGSGSGDVTPVHMMLEPGELLKVIPKGMWGQGDISPLGSRMNPIRAAEGFQGTITDQASMTRDEVIKALMTDQASAPRDEAIKALMNNALAAASGLSRAAAAGGGMGYLNDNGATPTPAPAAAPRVNSFAPQNNDNSKSVQANVTINYGSDTPRNRLSAKQEAQGFIARAVKAAG